LPQPLVQAFQWPSVAARTTVDGVVTVADAEALAHGLYAPDPAKVEAQRAADDSLDHETPVEELFADQMRCADLVVLSKTDRITGDALETVNQFLDGKRAGVGVVRSTADGLPADLLIGLGAGAEQDMRGREAGHHHHDDHDHEHDDHHHHHDHSHDEFDSRVVAPPAFVSKQALDAFVSALCAKPGVLRVKGVAQVEGKAAPVVVQAVGPRVTSHFDTSGRRQKAGLVVIGLSPLADLSDVLNLESAA
jgi:cobalamin biosynthesis protein CobW